MHSGKWADTSTGLRGFSKSTGIATLGEGVAIEGTVRINGTREGNPTRVLGERQAGFVLGHDAFVHGGVAATLDATNGLVALTDLANGQILAEAKYPVHTGRDYLVRLSTQHGKTRVTVDGVTLIVVQMAIKEGLVGAIVRDAEVDFAISRLPGGSSNSLDPAIGGV